MIAVGYAWVLRLLVPNVGKKMKKSAITVRIYFFGIEVASF